MSSQTFTTPGSSTFNWPDGVVSALAQCWGAGSDSTLDAGGGGAYAEGTVSRGGVASDTVFVGNDDGSVGSFGNPTLTYAYFRNTSTVLARGGHGTSPGLSSLSVGSTKFSGGGVGTSFDDGGGNVSGGGGGGGAGSGGDGSAGTNATNGTTPGTGGAGGTPDGGAGGDGGFNATGNAGVVPGGGAGGSGDGSNAKGAAGQVVVTWTDGHLTITLQPVNTAQGGIIHATVEVRDSGGTVDTNASGSVTVTTSGGGSLGGTTTKSPVSGVYDFTNLTLSATGTGLTLTFTHNSTGYTVVSDAFDSTAADVLHPQACL